ncbi:unnamed protein product [Allacma fusca]|uniref:Dynein light chain roadblock n=1 Tax=Allacma fusca TaxID=39272 RepID=A0A8J2JBK6_9HEXA|nr:unnamed protein product [Allacma fusca]
MEFPDIDETIKRIQSHRGVQGVIIATKDGFPIRTTMDNTSTVLFIANMMTLEERAASMVRDIEPSNALLFMRIRSRKFEIMASAEDDYIVIVIQNPNES